MSVQFPDGRMPSQVSAGVRDANMSVSESLHPSASVENAVPSARSTPVSDLSSSCLKLLRTLRLSRGSRLAVWRVSPSFSLGLMFAADIPGVVPVWCNDRWGKSETAAALRVARVSWLVVGSDIALTDAEEVVAQLEGVGLIVLVNHETGGDDTQSSVLLPEWRIVRSPVYVETDTQAWPGHSGGLPFSIYFTSGTTGDPKAVVLSHRAMLSQARAKLTQVGYNDATRYLHLAPLFHLGGASSAIAVALAGGCIVFPRQSDSSPSGWLEAIEVARVNTLVVVPAVLQLLLDSDADIRRQGGSSPSKGRTVRTILYGGGSCSRALRSQVTCGFPRCRRLVGAYGMTEAASSMTFIDHLSLPSRSRLHASVGRAPSHVELQVRHVSDSFTTKDGWLVGEIVTRGPHVMDGYFGSEEATRAALEGDRMPWLATGDMGYLDGAGYLFLVGRLKDMIKTGGENVFAGEVEGVLSRHPAVISSAVVGLPHRVLGEAVCAAVITSTAWATYDSLAAWCRKRLSPYKCPKWIVPFERFPANPTGKVLKNELRNQLRSRIGSQAKL